MLLRHLVLRQRCVGRLALTNVELILMEISNIERLLLVVGALAAATFYEGGCELALARTLGSEQGLYFVIPKLPRDGGPPQRKFHDGVFTGRNGQGDRGGIEF